MSFRESTRILDREGAEVSDSVTRTDADLVQFEIQERQERQRNRRWLRWILPIITGLWLGLIAWMVVTRAIEGVQIGLALGIPGAALLTLVGMQVSWAYGGRGKPAGGLQHVLRPGEPNGR